MSENGDLNDPLPNSLPRSGKNRNPLCGAPTLTGAPCQAPGMLADGHCYKHSGLVSEESRLVAVRKGGLASRAASLPDAPDPRLATTNDIRKFIERTAGSCTRGELHHDIGKINLEAAEVALRVLEIRTLETRLLEIEGTVAGELGP